MFDSTADTLQHIARVQGHGGTVLDDLSCRFREHDLSKLREPEKSAIDRVRPQLKTLPFGSPEYVALKNEFAQFHYKVNDHHAEFFPNGINDMTLLHLIEMMCDWKAATETNGPDDGIMKSIQILKDKLGISPQLEQIMINTVDYMGWDV
jgi:hypothetical protein